MENVIICHVGTGNHGCDAIVRSNAKDWGNRSFLLLSQRPNEDIRYGLDRFFTVIKKCNAAANKN